MNLRHFFRMAQWVRNPPSAKRVILVFSIVAICLSLALIEYLGLWPDALSANHRIKIRPSE